MVSSGDQLNEFLSYLDQSLARISNLCDSAHDGQCRSFKKALLFSFIDNLSTLAYPANKSDFAKVRKLITNYGNWPDSNLLSTPHLCRWLETHPETFLPSCLEIAKTKLHEWEPGCIVPISRDMDYRAIQRHIRSGHEVAAASIDRLNHLSLLWNQRHNLIHRFMPIGLNLEFPDDNSPYYISLSSLSVIMGAPDKGPFWQLIYPTGFLFNLARTCLAGVSLNLRDKSIDIREHYRAGHYLLEELNQGL